MQVREAGALVARQVSVSGGTLSTQSPQLDMTARQEHFVGSLALSSARLRTLTLLG